MPPASTARGTAYLTALTLEIEKKLQWALASASQRRNLLQELFADVALEVDDRAKEIILGEEDAITASDESYSSPLCFYNVLANHFARMPENGKSILDLIVQLWSQSFASNIFSLLFHKWVGVYDDIGYLCGCFKFNDRSKNLLSFFLLRKTLGHDICLALNLYSRSLAQMIKDLDLFEFQLDNPVVLLRFSSALVQGATNVFWIDIQTNVRRFQSFFQYLLVEVALDSERLEKIPPQAQRDLFLLLSRVIIFYNSDDKLESFFKQFPDFPNAFFVGSAADIFVIELADQLQKLKVEPVLLYYLSRIKVLQGLELRLATSTRLKTCLYSFTSPGGPMYPTRAVRHAAWDALDFLFPVGRYPRHLISLFFRLLYPWYWPSSCWNFVRSCIQAVMYSLLRLIFSSWEKLRPKQSEA